MTQSGDRNSKPLNNLEDILLETFNTQNDGGGDEFSRLQELLVKPDILKMRQQIAQLEGKFPEIDNIRDRVSKLEEELPEIVNLGKRVTNLEKEVVDLDSQIDERNELIKIVLSLISELLNRKLGKLKTELLSEIVPLIEKQLQQEQTLSIRVSGINRDPD
ncbi:MAG TPA: hypothetical protein DEG17_04290 [Cyanobacteria bacterium UBA11149]|nr:hypothetical protein [Cyanobacteria bacterium UBA11367]HBE56130.1 hypothetical protein [Cyanobacteria bacterium UBA11366]HBK65219.1 hypothetical protein [Cyanobacteria bacterium UBA11166]HBR76906.1 hypothetical protein [Cyanobacteria bacterium UBA11159]HBS69250.1 hypothetical protein [Cyanobacteria bacterium UBA11153]HBW88109.1 hypothetical protein [Cyanobacteria bacterium UBA11149]HCA96854.1 hypothetical protein [Cyanobacteria bacterium UBA9226]